MSETRIAPMGEEDLAEVLVIESEGQARPWTEKIFVEELARDYAQLLVSRVEQAPARIAAYCNYWIVRDEAQLLNIVTAKWARRQGHGRGLMQALLKDCRSKGCVQISLEVRKGNLGAIALYTSYGFKTVGERPGYYADNLEDALVMIATL